MRASKENACEALKKVDAVGLTATSMSSRDLAFVREFLQAVIGKLPSDKAITDDLERRKARQRATTGVRLKSPLMTIRHRRQLPE